MKESEAKEKEISYKVLKFPWSASGRSVAMGESSGLTKLIVNQDTERVIGAAVVGKHAGDLISELVLAVEMAALASDVALTIHPHPTLSETIMEAAESFYGYFTHFMGKK
jgi:dihydrolipoamide dehydrogenase